MLEEYDIDKLNPRPNPYAKELNKQVTVKIAPSVIEFFKDEAMETGIPYGAEKADIGKEVAEELDELDKMVALRGLMKDLDRAKARADREGWIDADESERILQ